MLSLLRDRTHPHLFLAHAVALTGRGLAAVALALLAYDLAGVQTSAVLGTALALSSSSRTASPARPATSPSPSPRSARAR
ncbi:hypothetical protein [Streptomyces sp. NPDC085466]|uniref:hypothetical protein n=1 Tax=Streptomyces sp. NPDC085466 TaxID=3365725 RepID=UPI0037CE3182